MDFDPFCVFLSFKVSKRETQQRQTFLSRLVVLVEISQKLTKLNFNSLLHAIAACGIQLLTKQDCRDRRIKSDTDFMFAVREGRK